MPENHRKPVSSGLGRRRLLGIGGALTVAGMIAGETAVPEHVVLDFDGPNHLRQARRGEDGFQRQAGIPDDSRKTGLDIGLTRRIGS